MGDQRPRRALTGGQSIDLPAFVALQSTAILSAACCIAVVGIVAARRDLQIMPVQRHIAWACLFGAVNALSYVLSFAESSGSGEGPLCQAQGALANLSSLAPPCFIFAISIELHGWAFGGLQGGESEGSPPRLRLRES